jgi:D-sedoheptulose 7-phosphate isomerase
MAKGLDIVNEALRQGQQALAALIADPGALHAIERAGALLVDCFKNGGRVYACGNGGSMCDAMHFAEELSGRFRKDRIPLPAMAISDPAHLSCTANDFGYQDVFSRFVMAHGKKGDVLVAISTSGSSPNIMAAARVARENGVSVIALTGKKDCPVGELSHCHIATPGGTQYSDRVQELHIKCIHILIELVESGYFAS